MAEEVRVLLPRIPVNRHEQHVRPRIEYRLCAIAVVVVDIEYRDTFGSMVAQAVTGVSMESDSSTPISFFAADREPIQLESKSVLA